MAIHKATMLALALLALSACGRRGELEAPGEPGVPLESQAAPVAVTPQPSLAEESLLDPQSPGSQEPTGASRRAGPDRPFVLDPLL